MRLALVSLAVVATLVLLVAAARLPPHCVALDERTGTCVCEVGYAGPRCDACARGSVRRPDGACVAAKPDAGAVHDDFVEDRPPRPHDGDHDDDDDWHWRGGGGGGGGGGGDGAGRGGGPDAGAGRHSHLSEGEVHAVTVTTLGMLLVGIAILVLIAMRALAILRAGHTAPDGNVEHGDYGTDDEGSGSEGDSEDDAAGMGSERQPFLAGPSHHGQQQRQRRRPHGDGSGGTRRARKGDGL